MSVHLHEIDIPPPWQRALDRLSARPGTIMILGALDTGKSTLARLTVHALQQTGRTVAWIDCDVGQSDLGPPTTIGLAMVKPSTDVERGIPTEAMRFVGSVSPSGHLLPMVVGAHRLVQRARQRGAEAIVINTTGMVHGGPARALKQALIDVIRPDVVLALQAQAEIEHLLRPLQRQGQCRIDRLPLSKKVRRWSRDARRETRQVQFRAYFQTARTRALPFSRLSLQNTFLNSGVRLPQKQLADASSTLDTAVVYGEHCGDGVYLVVQGGARQHNLDLLKQVFGVERITLAPLSNYENRLVGLCDAENDLLALGSLQQIDWLRETLHLLTPLPATAIKDIKVAQFGSLRVDSVGREYPLQWAP